MINLFLHKIEKSQMDGKPGPRPSKNKPLPEEVNSWPGESTPVENEVAALILTQPMPGDKVKSCGYVTSPSALIDFLPARI